MRHTSARRRSCVAALAVALASCGGTGPPGSSADWSALGLQMPPAIEASSLPDPDSNGALLIARYCSQCHGIPSPASHSAADWRPTFRRMLERMAHSSMMGPGMMRGMPMGMHGADVPTAGQADSMLAYLERHALVALPEAELPEAGTADAQLFAATCSRCHALPSPAQHAPADWPSVVARMRQHMSELQVPGISERDASVITTYLEEAAERAAR